MASRGPGLGPAHFFFADAQHGYVATTGGSSYLEHTGVQPPTERAEIDETLDGGATWRTLWRGRGAVLHGVGFSGKWGYAVGERRGGSFMLATRDAGRTWRLRRVPFPVQVDWRDVPNSTPLAVEAFGRTIVLSFHRTVAASDDAGRTWRRIRPPRFATVVRFATPRLGYAGGRCIWRTLDGGASWTRMDNTCGPPVADLDPHGSIVAAAQSFPWQADVQPRNVVRVSVNAGVTWQVATDVRGTRWPSLARVHFADRRHGWAIAYEDVQHLVRSAVFITRDGGQSWVERRAKVLPTAFVASTHAWAGSESEGWVWRTDDAGRTWHLSVRPEHVNAYGLLEATERRLFVESGIGTVVTRDGGRGWARSGGWTPREAATFVDAPAHLDFVNGGAFVRDGRAWRALHPPTIGTGMVGFADPRRGFVASGQDDGYGRVPVATSDDGGRSWRTVRVPRGVHRGDYAAVGPGIVAILTSAKLYVTLDVGSHWLKLALPSESAHCTPAAFGVSAWVACRGSSTSEGAVILRTEDRGKTWTRRHTRRTLDVTPVSATEAWAVSGWNPALPHPVWHTTDGGATWTSVWPRIRPDTVFAVRSPR